MRGKRLGVLQRAHDFGITPAGAGKTPSCDGRPPEHEDHPRRCGENAVHYTSIIADIGSPPQVRGKLEFETRLPFESGITPAGAGKTILSMRDD